MRIKWEKTNPFIMRGKILILPDMKCGALGFGLGETIWPEPEKTKKVINFFQCIRLQVAGNQRIEVQIGNGELIIVRSADALEVVSDS